MFSPPNGRPRLPLPGLAIRKKPVLWPFRVPFWAPLTWLTAFRSEYLGRQELRTSETVSTGSLPSWSGLALKKRSFDERLPSFCNALRQSKTSRIACRATVSNRTLNA